MDEAAVTPELLDGWGDWGMDLGRCRSGKGVEEPELSPGRLSLR